MTVNAKMLIRHFSIRPLLELLFPPTCPACGKQLPDTSKPFCIACSLNLPRLCFSNQRDNRLTLMFQALLPFHSLIKVETATAYFRYTPQTLYSRLIIDFKYKGHRHLATQLAKTMFQDHSTLPLYPSGIDYIIPVPIHTRRIGQRGYNQSFYIAKGLLEHFPTATILQQAVKRFKHTRPQVEISRYKRKNNLDGAFLWNTDIVKQLIGKQVLIVDDVITTGSTIHSLVSALTPILDGIDNPANQQIHLHILSLGYAGKI